MKKRTIIFLIVSIAIFIIIFIVALMVGRFNIGFSDFFKAIFTNDSSVNKERNVIIILRLPRTLMAGLAGIGLSISGLLYQETFQNKLVSPDLLGVSNGAGVGAALAIILGLSSYMISLLAFICAIFTVCITILISKVFKNRSSVMLLLSGIIVSGFMSALLSLIKYLANPETQLSDITYWLMGSFSNVKIENVYILAPIVLVSIILLISISWRINIIALGKEEAQAKGINYEFYRGLIIVVATLLTAVSVSFCGVISWIGLVIPHIVRLFTGKNTVRSIPFTIIFGGIFMIIADIISRTLTDSEIPLSAVTGLIGTIVFVIILVANRRKFYER